MFHTNKMALCVCAMLVLGSCNFSKTPPVASFVPPLIELPTAQEVIPFTYFTVSPAEGGSFQTNRGTRVTFPADAFVFTDGTPVTEPVQIHFREYHSVSDVILSGIRMTAQNNNGETLPFESAGMFEIDGQCNGKKVEIAKGKTARVELPNPKPDPDFNFYRLDENGWTELQKNLPALENVVTEATKQEAAQALPPQPVAPEQADEKTFVFDLNMDTYRYPELKELYGVMWQYAGEKGSNTDPEANTKITETNWLESDIERTPDNTYNLVLRKKGQLMSIPVKPVLRGKNYAEAKARFDKKMDKYQTAVKKKEDAQRHMAMEQQYTRSLNIAGFGTYNCDRFYNVENPQQVQAQLRSDGKELPEGTFVYQIIKTNVSIRLYPGQEATSLQYSQLETNRLLAIFPDQTVGIVRAQEFSSATAMAKNNSAQFHFQKLPLENITPEKLEQAIAGI